MSHIPEAGDLEAEMEALIKLAGDSLRQQVDRETQTARAATPNR
jgi:hypothetical protein